MIQSFHSRFSFMVFFFMLFAAVPFEAQRNVFTENFNAPGVTQSSAWTTAGPIGNSRWNVTRSGNDFGGKIEGGMLTLSNDVSSAGNSNGWVLASTSTSNFAPGYNPILNQNAGIVSWNFNMRQSRSNPSGLTAGQYGVAYVLAGTEDSSFNTGSGYAIMLGNSGSKDVIRFVHYTNGISTYYTKFTSNVQGFKDFGTDYISVRVEYNPATSKWSFYLRKDNPTFLDPKGGTLYYQGDVTNNEHITKSLTMTGAYWVAGGANNQTALFDNISVDVVLPEIIAIDPDSKIANSGPFNLIVEGKGFTSASKVYWNGVLRPTTFNTTTKLLTVAIPASDITLPVIIPITVKNGTYESNAVPFQVEPSGVPALTLSKNMLPFISTVTGTASVPTDTYTIKGIALIADATVTAPANFEISLNGTNYFDNLILPINEGVLAGGTLTLRARLKASAPAGNFSGNITHATTGAVTKQVVVSGRVLATEPITLASEISFSNITSTGFKLNWTNGSGEQRLVLIREASAVNALPVDAATYSASSVFANGAEIGAENYVVYNGTGNNIQITSLQPNTTYHISVTEFNGVAGTENYKSSGLTGSQKTLNSPAGLQLKIADTSYKIDFDQTVDGVNLDTFQGSGIAKIAETGQLDSDSWAFTGFSVGAIAFGGESLEDSSYENGASEGNEVDTGMYAFNVGTTEAENFTLGIQPGGPDFNPGTITLKIHNQTGAPMTSVNIGYKVYVYNDQPTSSQIRFSSSSNGTSFVDQSIVDVISPITADLAPGWKAYYRVITIPDLNIAKDTFYYIRWSGSLASGSGAQDEFAIDDIEVIANPSTNTVSFDGVAEDFVLQGNANLSNDLSVQNRFLFNGGQLTIKDNTVTIAGSVTNTTANGLIGGATSNLIIRGTKNPALSFDQTASRNVLQNFSLIGANANTVTLTNSLAVNQLLQVDELQILDLGTSPLNGTLNSIQNNGLILTQNTTTPFTAGKIWSGTGILNLNAASAAQTLVSGTYNNLTLSSTGGTTGTADVIVNGILHLPSANASTTTGSLDMATSTLVMGPDGTNTGIGDVTGITKRNFFTTNKLYTFGHPNSSIIFPGGGTQLPSTMSAKLTLGAEPTWRAGTIKRYYDIIQTGAVSTKAIIRQHYLDSELNGNAETKLVFWGHKVVGDTDFEQGKSSNNVSENWVEISNANVAQYFVNEFDKVYITLDETQGVGEIVWNGSDGISWTTLENWTPNVKPGATTKVIIPAAVPNFPTLNPSETIGSLIIETGATVTSTDTALLFLTAGAGAWQNYGNFKPGTGTSTVTFNNVDATIAGSTDFNNLTIAAATDVLPAAGLRALEGNYMSIAGTLTNGGTMFTTLIPNTIEFKGTNQVIPNVNGLDFGGYHNLIVSGSGTPKLAPSISTLNVRGNLTLNQPLNFAGKTVNMAGVSDQTIGGTAAIGFNDLIVNKETGAVNLAQDISVDATLTLTKGNVVINDKNLTLGSNAVAGTFGTNTMIVADGAGLVKRPFAGVSSYFYPIGELSGAASYSPIIVEVKEGTFAADAFVGVNVVDEKHPQNFSSQDFISRYWNVTQTGISNAVSTITGTYDPLDFNGEESAIAAAQLKGNFDLENNPWTKFTSLANNTLFAEGAVLNSGQNSVFTGIKAGAFTVEVYGYGDFCLGSDVEIEAVVTNGDAPFTYIWTNGLANSATVTIPTNVVGTTDYTITVIDANGLRANDNNIPIDIFPQTVGGTISNSSQEICAGSQPGDLELIGSIGKVLHWQKSRDINFTANTESNPDNVTNISNFTTTLLGSEIGPINQTTYFRAVLQNGDCAEQYSTIATVTVAINTWNGTTWSGGFPGETNKLSSLVFAANYDTSAQDPLSATIYACNFQVNAGVILTIKKDTSLKIINGITNNGSIIVESDASLIQINDNAVNTGNILVKRILSFRDDSRKEYNYLISPVEGGDLKTKVYRKTDGTPVNAPFTLYHTESNNKFYNSSGAYIAGRGLAVKEPALNSGALATAFFEGKPFNGIIAYNLFYSGPSLGYNLVGNPYPSNLDLNVLYADNQAEIESTFQFWDNTANAIYEQQGSGYTGNAYAVFNAVAGERGTGLPAPGKEQQEVLVPRTPNNIVKVGQGFMVKAKGTGKILNYRNYGRTAVNEGSVFYGKQSQEDRYFLKMTAPSGITSTIAMVYFAGGNNLFGTDDSAAIPSSDEIYSIVQGEKVAINGRSTFVNMDTIPLGTRHFVGGDYTIALGDQEGIFANGQSIYLKDKQTNTITNLNAGNYTFTTSAGASTGRFEIIYQSDVVLVTESTFKEELTVYRDGEDFVVKAQTKKITGVEVYDMSGRLIFSQNANNTKVVVNGTSLSNGTYLLKINQGTEVYTKKILK